MIAGYDQLIPFAIYTPAGNTRPLYVLVQGSYADLGAARQARDLFPGAIQSPDRVWIRQFGMIQSLVKE